MALFKSSRSFVLFLYPLSTLLERSYENTRRQRFCKAHGYWKAIASYQTKRATHDNTFLKCISYNIASCSMPYSYGHPRYGAAYWGMLREEPPSRDSHDSRSVSSYGTPSSISRRSSMSSWRPRRPPSWSPPRGPATSPNVYEVLSSNEGSRDLISRARDLPSYTRGSRSPSVANEQPGRASRSHRDRSSGSRRRSTSHPLPASRRSSRRPASHSELVSRRSSRHAGGSNHDSDHSRSSSMHGQVSGSGSWTFERPHSPARGPARRTRSPPGSDDERPRFSSSQAHRRGHRGRECNELRDAVRDSDRRHRREGSGQRRNELRDAVRDSDRSDKRRRWQSRATAGILGAIVGGRIPPGRGMVPPRD